MSVITGIVEGGPAYIAGLREGQKIVGMSVTRDEPERLAKFKVHTGEGDQQVSFYPRGKPVTAWQYQLDPSRACNRQP